MADQPHPADYMSDASYEQYRRDGGISHVDFDVDILNYSIDADEELLIEQYSGEATDLSDRALEVAEEAWGNNMYAKLDQALDGGDWLVIADGEIEEMGAFHPYRVHVRTE